MPSLGRIQIKYDAQLRDESGRFLSEVRAGAVGAANEMADLIAARAMANAPFKTGELKGGFEIIRQGARAIVVSRVKHASSQESGARAHAIPGGFGREGSVQHPGNPALHFLGRAGLAVAAISSSIVKRNMPNL